MKMKKTLQFLIAAIACASLSVTAGTHHVAPEKTAAKHAIEKQKEQVEKPQEQEVTTSLGSPVVSVGAPNAFGGAETSIFLTGTYVNHWSGTNQKDGLMNVGVTFGDPHQYIGVVLSSAFTSLGINNQSFGSNGFVGLRLNRYFTPDTAIALGVTQVHGWGASRNEASSFYGVLTDAFTVGLPMAINVGLGTGAFNNSVDLRNKKDNNVNGFVGFGVTLFSGASLAVDYAAEEVNVGGTYVLMLGRHVPAFISLAGKNLNKHGGSAYFQAVGGLSYLFE